MADEGGQAGRSGDRHGDRGAAGTSGMLVCESCATLDDELVLVRRVYVAPERWDAPASEGVADPPELWCISCCSQYPHEAVDAAVDDERRDR